MPADVSGLVNLLATQPGQNVARLGQTLRQAEEDFRARKQQEFENNRAMTKDALEKALFEKKIQMSDLEIMSKKAEIAVPIAGQLLMTRDPLTRQQLFEQSIPTLKQIGMEDQGINEFRANLGNNDFIAGKVAQGLSAKDLFALYKGTSGSPTAAYQKKMELIEAGVPPEQAEGIAYGTYKVVTDDTGTQRVFDLRSGGRLSPEKESVVLANTSPQEMGGKYEPKIITKGTKEEIRIQKAVADLAKDMKATNAPDIEDSLSTVESIIANTYEKGEDLPGVGPLEGSGLYPDWAVTEQGQDLRQAAVKLFNMTLADRSGAAVTNPEFERLKDEFKSGAWKTERQFVEGVRAFRRILEDHKKATLAGYDPVIVERYQKQGGIRLKEAPVEEKKPTVFEQLPDATQYKGKVVKDTATGKRYRSNGTDWEEVK